ncbi:MAG: hypothetical protein M3R07_06675, partial [Gemmatimonadota bacterium]|nr:hypothetical protein [Gemmatimonadota bacterium]
MTVRIVASPDAAMAAAILTRFRVGRSRSDTLALNVAAGGIESAPEWSERRDRRGTPRVGPEFGQHHHIA